MEIICAGSLTVLELGKRGSNQTRAIRFDIAEWMADYPDGSVHILHKRPGEETPLPVSNTEKTDTYIDWVIEQADVANEGYGECELVMMDTISHTAKSVTYMTHIGTPISSSDETVPEPHQGWVDSVLQAATDAEAAKNAAVDAQTAAETAQAAAEAAQTAAEKAQNTAENAKASAVMSSNAAYNYAADANTAKRDSVNAKTDAVQAKEDAVVAQRAAEDAEDSANTSALKSEGYAVGTQNGTPAGSGEPYYQDNAKYYKEQAAAAKTAAEAARDTAQQTVAGIEAAGTAQVQRVAAEGATQVGNVQTKGQQVLDSIPDDYSELSGEVTNLKSASNSNTIQAVQSSIPLSSTLFMVWEQGSIGSDGSLTDLTSRIRTKPILTEAINKIAVTVPSGYKYGIAGYDKSGTFVAIVREFTTSNNSYNISEYAYIRFYYANTENTTISPSAGDDLIVDFTSKNTDLYNKTALNISGIGNVNSLRLSPEWEQGSLSSGAETVSQTRIRTKYIYVDGVAEVYLSAEDGYSFDVSWFNDNQVLIGSIGAWFARRMIVISSDIRYIRVILRKNDNTAISVDNKNNVTIVPKMIPEIRYNMFNPAMIGADGISIYRGINLSSGNPSASEARAATDYIYAKKGSIISLKSPDSVYYFTVVLYNDDYTFNQNIADRKVYYFENDTIFRLIFRINSGTTLTDSDINAIQNQLKYVESPINHYHGKYKDKVRGINHGGWRYAPMNNVIAYQQSYLHGFRWVETDLHFTSDGVCVLLHDDTINNYARNPDGTKLSEPVYIDDITYEQALSYDFGTVAGYPNTVKISTLDEVLLFCKESGLGIYLDIKTGDWLTTERIHQIVDTVQKYGMTDMACYIASHVDVLRTIVDYYPSACVGINTNASNYSYCFYLLTGENAVWMNAQQDTITSAKVSILKQYNIPLEGWVYTTETIVNADDYVTGYTVNDFLPEEYFLTKSGAPIQTEYAIEAVASRATDITGNVFVKNSDKNTAVVNIKFTSAYTGASGSYQILRRFPVPAIGYATLICTEITDNGEKGEAKNCFVNGSGIALIENPQSGADYVINGSYLIS